VLGFFFDNIRVVSYVITLVKVITFEKILTDGGTDDKVVEVSFCTGNR